MITQRSEYLFVTIPASIQVNDEVMPKRYSNPQKRRVLRGLDAAMMYECVGERNAVVGAAVKKVNMTREILGAPFFDAASWCVAHCGASSIWRAQVEESVGFWDVGNVGLPSVYGRTISAIQLESDWTDFLAGKPLDADKLMGLYKDMNLFRRFLPPVTKQIASSNYAMSHDKAGETGGGYSPADDDIARKTALFSNGGAYMGGGMVYYHTAINWADTIFESSGRWHFTSSLASGTYRVFPPAEARLDLYGETQAYVLMETVYRLSHATGGSISGGKWYDWIQVAAEKHASFHGYGISSTALTNAAEQARAERDITARTTSTLIADRGQRIEQTALAFALAVDLTDHTRVEVESGE